MDVGGFVQENVSDIAMFMMECLMMDGKIGCLSISMWIGTSDVRLENSSIRSRLTWNLSHVE